MLKDVANLDHVQIDAFTPVVETDQSGPEFFRYDISWVAMCDGRPDLAQLLELTGVDVTNIDLLSDAMEGLFARFAPLAIAVKSQHAYNRTLKWEERSRRDAAGVLGKILAGTKLSEGDRLCLGDWCLGRGVELSIQHNLPFKIHTGYYAGHGYMQPGSNSGGTPQSVAD